MGHRKARIKAFANKILPIAEYMKIYQHSLRALFNSLPSEKVERAPGIASIGRVDIWPCQDGALVLTYRSESKDIEVFQKDPIGKSVDEFIRLGSECGYYNEKGQKASISAIFSILPDASKVFVNLADNQIIEGGHLFRPKYNRCAIIGWEAKLPEPDEEALKDFKSAFIARNIAGPEALNLSLEEERRLTKSKADELLRQFNELLETAQREEELQVFLKDHPEFLYPDFIDCHPKFQLGEDYVTDYVLLVQGHQGPEYIFVEIERPDKELFTNSGQFSANFTQAKNQLLDWDNWLTKNHAYVSQKQKLPNLYKPQFHLVFGRGNKLDLDRKEKIQSEFTGTTRRFSTYDDLANRFKVIIERLIEPNKPIN
jgi:hypothetical protein